VNAAKVLAEARDREDARRKAEQEARLLREEQERAQRWTERLASTPWVPLIAHDGGDLENWSIRSWVGKDIKSAKVAWTVQVVDGQPTITAGGHDEEVELGMNGNRWQDWILEFDVKVDEGDLKLKARTKVSGSVFQPRVEEGVDPITLSSSDYKSWKRVRLEVRGKKIAFFEGGDSPKVELEPTLKEGGFLLALDKGSSASIRNVQLKLVYTTKQPRDEEEEEESE
jgi:hypothetical protein